MTDRLFADCCYGSEHQHLPTEPCPQVEEKRVELVNDWNAMVAHVAEFSEKHDFPKGELIFPAMVLDNLRDASSARLLDTFIVRGVRARFGHFEQSDVFRQY